MAGIEKTKDDYKEVKLKTLDDIVSVNSLFTIAAFIGLTIKSPGQSNLAIQPECRADPRLATKVISYEILSFACFLFSSLLAKSLKIYLNMFHTDDSDSPKFKVFPGSVFAFIGLGSLAGMGLLTATLIFLLELNVGKLSCHDTLVTFVISCAIVVLPAVFYLVSMCYATMYFMVF